MQRTQIIARQIFDIIARNFLYNRFYTLINVGGLALGLTCAIFILLFINDEITYDQHHINKDRIYRLESDFSVSGRSQQVAKTSWTFGPVFKSLFPEIEDFVRFYPIESVATRAGKREFFERGLMYADSSIFNIFCHDVIYGLPDNALNAPNTIVLTKSMSERYFGDIDPVGRSLEMGNGLKCKVTAVIADVPSNSHIQFDGLISVASYARLIGESVFHDLESRQPWAMRVFTFVLMKENTSIESIHNKFPSYYEQHMAELSKRFHGTYELMSSPLTSIHLYSGLAWDLNTGDITTVYLFAIIGIFILLIAAINYMNLATARSSGKAREVGIRKVTGASRGNLIQLFITESVVMTLISLALALTLADLMMPWFNNISGKSMVLLHGINDPILYIFIAISIIVGIIAGLYPAFYLSAFKPANVLYGRMLPGQHRGLPRKILMFIQFSISISLIIATIIVFEQLRHIKTADMGFNKEQLMVITVKDTNALNSYPVLREKLMQIPEVRNVSSSFFITGIESAGDIMVVEDSGHFSRELISLNYVSHHYIDLMEMEIITGRDFDQHNQQDAEQHIIINETLANKMGWDKNPIGRRIAESAREDHHFKVIGVVSDFHFSSLHKEIAPHVFFVKEEAQQNILIRLGGINQAKTIKFIGHTWKVFFPDIPFAYVFLDQELKDNYLSEDSLLRTMGLFTLFSIFIALLGLFGLSSFMTEKHSREISVRKIFGASPLSIVYHLSKQYLILIFLSCIVAMPLCWYFMQRWLEDFAYRIDIQLWWFIITAIMVMLVAEVTVIYQSHRAANRNPADTLRYE